MAGDIEVDEEGWYWDEELGDWANIYDEEGVSGDLDADLEVDEEGWYWDEELGDWANIYDEEGGDSDDGWIWDESIGDWVEDPEYWGDW